MILSTAKNETKLPFYNKYSMPLLQFMKIFLPIFLSDSVLGNFINRDALLGPNALIKLNICKQFFRNLNSLFGEKIKLQTYRMPSTRLLLAHIFALQIGQNINFLYLCNPLFTSLNHSWAWVDCLILIKENTFLKPF